MTSIKENNRKVKTEDIKKDGGWLVLSSLFKTSNDKASSDDKSDSKNLINNTVLPSTSRFHDLVLYLKNQENELINHKLQMLVNRHERYLTEGDRRLSENRVEIMTLIDTVSTGYDSLTEIYQSILNEKSLKYETYNNWEVQKTFLENTIHAIINESPEGCNYKELLETSAHMGQEIKQLEAKLSLLKQKKKLVDQQLLETNSLVDIKLNKYKDELDTLLNNEATETRLLFKEKQLNSEYLTGNEVELALEGDILKLKIIMDETSYKKIQFQGFESSLKDVFKTLSTMEYSMSVVLRENRSEQLQALLTSTRSYLIERLNSMKEYRIGICEKLVIDEIKAIEKGMNLLNIPILHDLNASRESTLSSDSTEYYNITESLLSQEEPKRKAISVSPPKTLFTEITATSTTATATATFANKPGFGSSKAKEYDNLIKEIKNAKGDKKD